jgi:hypothetical protein
MVGLIAEIAIAVGTAAVATPGGQAAVNAARVYAPRVIRGIQRAKRSVASLTPRVSEGALEVMPEVGKLGAGLAPIIITGFGVTATGCGGSGGESAPPPVTVTENPPQVTTTGTPPGGGTVITPVECVCVVLSWNPNQESDLAGYKVQWGTSSQDYSSEYYSSNSSVRLQNLQKGNTYYFAVRAYDFSGNESDPSNEVSKSFPAAQ